MDIKLIELNLDNIILLEKTRFKCFGIESSYYDMSNTYSANEMAKGKYLVYGAFIKDNLVGACYVSNSWSTLYVEYIFVLPEYQKHALHVGSTLLKYVLSQKKYINEYYNCEFTHSYLDSSNKSSGFYEKLGYTKSNVPNFMKKTLV